MNKWVTMLVAMSLSLSALGDNRVTLGAPKTAEGQPAMYFGVNSCGKMVMRVLLTNGHIFRIDDDHSPADMKDFVKQLVGVNGDLVEIPCPTVI
jgi:hypothetical protein